MKADVGPCNTRAPTSTSFLLYVRIDPYDRIWLLVEHASMPVAGCKCSLFTKATAHLDNTKDPSKE